MDQLKWFLTIAFSFSGTLFAETNTLSEDWFQIDTIIFEYLEPDTSESMGNEDKKSYPQNVIAIDKNLKIGKEDDGFEARDELQSMENGYPNANQNISFELESESARRFNRELLEALIKRSSENQFEDSSEKTQDIAENGFRAKIINRYELNQIERYQEKLFILRFSGLYDSISQKNSLNVLHRNNAAKIINFFIEYTSLDHINPIFNCSEDQNEEASNISNSKLKKTGFIFDAYN